MTVRNYALTGPAPASLTVHKTQQPLLQTWLSEVVFERPIVRLALQLNIAVLLFLGFTLAAPWPALLAVSQTALEPDTLAMLTGAALGALHGPQPGWFLDPEIDKLLNQVKKLNF